MDFSKTVHSIPAIGICYQPDPYGQVLGTGMQRFRMQNSVEGLCKFDRDFNGFELLAVHVDELNRGQGLFRDFIKTMKQHFATIKVWHIENDFLAAKLLSYGFRPWSERQCVGGHWETQVGFRWDK